MTWVDVGANVAAARNDVVQTNQPGIAALTLRSDLDSAYVPDGDLALLQVDEEGRLKTSSKTASFAAAQGTVAAVNAQVAVDVSRASNVVVHVKNTSGVNMTAGVWAFEASIDSTNGTDGTWFAVQAVRSNGNSIELSTGTLTINAGLGLTYSWELSVNAYQWFRVRCTTAATASTTPVWTIRRGSYATEPIPAAQASATQPVSGSLTSAGTVTNTPATPTHYFVTTTASTNQASVKATAGTLYEVTVSNVTATPVFVKLYNKATAPVAGTDQAVVTIQVPANTTQVLAFPPVGKRFTLGIAVAATGAAANTDTTSAVAGVQIHASYI